MSDPKNQSEGFDLRAVQARLDEHDRYRVGITTRAVCPDGMERLVDIAQLDELSLLRWMRKGGGEKNPRAERVVLYALGWKPY
jgi:hypothetical protein